MNEPLVEISSVDRSIPIKLRYSTKDNIVGRVLYPRSFRARLRKSTVDKVAMAHQLLKRSGHTLLIWDAYRPLHVQQALWEASKNSTFFAPATDPNQCLHVWGVAIDATLADRWGKPLPMPTDFDTLSILANYHYVGPDPRVRKNLKLLRSALGRAGFYGISSEWWHFVAVDWEEFGPIPDYPPPDYFRDREP